MGDGMTVWLGCCGDMAAGYLGCMLCIDVVTSLFGLSGSRDVEEQVTPGVRILAVSPLR